MVSAVSVRVYTRVYPISGFMYASNSYIKELKSIKGILPPEAINIVSWMSSNSTPRILCDVWLFAYTVTVISSPEQYAPLSVRTVTLSGPDTQHRQPMFRSSWIWEGRLIRNKVCYIVNITISFSGQIYQLDSKKERRVFFPTEHQHHEPARFQT